MKVAAYKGAKCHLMHSRVGGNSVLSKLKVNVPNLKSVPYSQITPSNHAYILANYCSCDPSLRTYFRFLATPFTEVFLFSICFVCYSANHTWDN